MFGGVDAISSVFDSSTQMTCVSPPHLASVVDVAVRNPDTRQGVLGGAYIYAGSMDSGNMVVTMNGSDVQVDWTGSSTGIFEVSRSTDPSDFSGAKTFTVYYGTTLLDSEAGGDGTEYFYLVE